ncbi:MAG: hypothetical protein OCC49_11220 [Fibrobacterales bacterium]
MAAFISLVLLDSLWSNPVEGLFEFTEDSYSGTAALQFLKLPSGARPLGMGGNIAAIDIQPTSIHWNPAAIADIYSYWSTLSHTEIFGEWRHEYIATTVPSPFSRGTFGFAGSVLMTTPFTNSRDIYEDKNSFYATDVALSAGYGWYLIPDIFSMGATGSFLASLIDSYSGISASVDISARGKLIYGMYSSLSLNNISPGITYNTSTDDGAKLPTTLQWSIGKPLTKHPGSFPFAWSIGYTKTNDGYQVAQGGLELAFLGRSVFARGGYEYSIFDTELDWSRGISMGAGFIINSLTIDYGFKMIGELGNYHSLSINFADVPKTERTPQNWLEMAQEAFGEGQCADATTYAKNHYKQHPANLEALTIIQRCGHIAREESGMYVNLVFTANALGRISPVWIDESPVGGLSRRATFFNTEQKRFPQTLLLDAGNIFDSTDTQLQSSNSVLAHGYEYLGYHSLNLGHRELSHITLKKMNVQLPWIQSQKSEALGPTISKETFYTFNGFTVAVVGLISQQIDDGFPHYIESFNRVRSGWSTRPHLIVALLDGTLKEAEYLALSAAQVDVIIVSGGEDMLERPIKINKTLIVCPGTLGTHVGELTLYFNDEKQVDSHKHRLVGLNADIQSDVTLSQLLNETLDYVSDQNNKSIIDQYVYKNFIYQMNTETDSTTLYIHEADKNYNYQITPPGIYTNISLAPSQSKFSYVTHTNGKDSIIIKNSGDSTATVIKTDGSPIHHVEWDALENWVYFTQKVSHTVSDIYRVTPLGYDKINLSTGRYGSVRRFDIAPNGRHLAYESYTAPFTTLYHSAMGLGRPAAFSRTNTHASHPKYSPDSKNIAFMERSDIVNGNDTLFNVLYWDIDLDTLYTVCEGKHVKDFSWNRDGTEILFSSGINITDINIFSLATERTHKLNTTLVTGSEYQPFPYRYLGQDGILYNYREGKKNSIYWQSQSDGKTYNLIDNSGHNLLVP